MSSSTEPASAGGSLRERNVGSNATSRTTENVNDDKVHELDVEDKESKTFGRTPDGTVFTVPTTHDMVSQLLDPRQPKNLSDVIVLAVIVLHVFALYVLPGYLSRPFFAVIFLFWRGCYNVGIGYLLQIQSHHRRLITWAKRWSLFENPATGKQPRPWLYKLLKRELETKIPEDYKFEEAPIEYNTWLVFRRVVDLILMCDFTSYCLFAIACGEQPVGEGVAFAIARWVTGIILVGFNLWVKLDAHRVVKDYAWYWGDFFYLIDQELTFDGVFEMAPHPMYSVGYAGYYGISMMAASYNVLFISIIAHVAQFVFLILVENPHIEKTYNPPQPRVRSAQTLTNEKPDSHNSTGNEHTDTPPVVSFDAAATRGSVPTSLHSLIGLKNFDAHRVTDTSAVLLISYVSLLAMLTPSTAVYQVLFVIHAVAWRLWYTLGLGIVLGRQSEKKSWTRHFVKWGETPEEAWRQWKGMYHLSMTMCWVSFIAACWKLYTVPADWGYGLVLMKHVLGAAMVALQIWTAFSIYDELSEFGWFFGDFFFDHAPKLTYSGIYRYLNNPERILGLAGVWGAVLITNSRSVFFLALLSHTATLSSIQFVEKPHMEKLYGRGLRKEAGLSKSIRRSLPPPLKEWQGRVDRVLGETSSFVEEFLDAARPKLAAGVSSFVKDTSALFSQYPARLTVTRLAPDLAGFNPKDYSVTIEGTPSASTAQEKFSEKEGQSGRRPSLRRSLHETLSFEYGAPIKVKWTAPANHSKKDWIGLYMVVDNASRDVTRISSGGRWIPTTRNEWDSTIADTGIHSADVPIATVEGNDLVSGEMIFQGDKLWWTQGVFEFRYHHDGKHNVMAISLPFSTQITRFDEEDAEIDSMPSTASPNSYALLRSAVETALLPVVQNCFDRDPEIAPRDVEESFGSLVEREGKFANRVVYAIRAMFGIEFASGVVLADGNVRKLSWRICNAKEVLAPYSMSHSKGTTTPTGEKF